MLVGRERLNNHSNSSFIRIEIKPGYLSKSRLDVDAGARMPLRLADKLSQPEFRDVIEDINQSLNQVRLPGFVKFLPILAILIIIGGFGYFITAVARPIDMPEPEMPHHLPPWESQMNWDRNSSDISVNSSFESQMDSKFTAGAVVIVTMFISSILFCMCPFMAWVSTFKRNINEHVRPLIDQLNHQYEKRSLRFELIQETHFTGFTVDHDRRTTTANFRTRYFVEIYIEESPINRPHVIIT